MSADNPEFNNIGREPLELGNILLQLRPEEFSNYRSTGALGAKPRQLLEAALSHVGNANDTVLSGLESLGHIISSAAANEERGMDMSVFMGIGGLISHLAVELEFLQELDFGLRERLERVEQKGGAK